MALKITMKKSLIGCKQNQIDTAKTFGLKRPGDVRVISHLVTVEQVD